MRLVDSFITEYLQYTQANAQTDEMSATAQTQSNEPKDKLTKEEAKLAKQNLKQIVRQVKARFLSANHEPSKDLRKKINSLSARVKDPIKIAICGQFSSGKSTFLNALLGKKVLPTGITPVTSKIIYLKYATSYQLQITYLDGREDLLEISQLSQFVDQRIDSKDVRHVTVYAPLKLLKKIVFIDTPGLNSQSDDDTSITQSVLREVDGIIWLTLIDSAMKKSEQETLDVFLDAYGEKSICVLNQKDKVSQVDINDTLHYVNTKFPNYFSEVIAISARQALEAMSHDQESQEQEEKDKLTKEFRSLLKQKTPHYDELKNIFDSYRHNVANIAVSAEDTQKLEISNIAQVVAFIKQEIRPKTILLKDYAIKKELLRVCGILAEKTDSTFDIYAIYEKEIELFSTQIESKAKELFETSNQKMQLAFAKLDHLLSSTSELIVSQIQEVKETRYFAQKKLLGENIEQVEFDFYKINQDRVVQSSESSQIVSIYGEYERIMQETLEEILSEFTHCYDEFQEVILGYRDAFAQRLDEDLFFIDLQERLISYVKRPFVNVLREFNTSLIQSLEMLKNEFTLHNSNTKSRYRIALFQTLSTLEREREQNKYSYLKNPNQFPIKKPSKNDIYNHLSMHFDSMSVKTKMIGYHSFLYTFLEKLKTIFDESKIRDLDTLESSKGSFVRNATLLEEISDDIKRQGFLRGQDNLDEEV